MTSTEIRLLFDQNLSYRLKSALRDLYPGSMHVSDFGLESADDTIVWSYARNHGYTIVSKDEDFRRLSVNLGHPPKLVWIQRGNATTSEIESLLRQLYDDIRTFSEDELSAFLALT